MPIYEYRCRPCGKKSEIITFRISESVAAACRHCGSDMVDRIPSRVRVRLSEETRMERLADPSVLGGLDENDPKSMIRWMKKMGQEMGDELGGEDMDAMIEEAMEEEAKGKPGGSDNSSEDDL